MSVVEKRKVEEILVQYELEPSLKDIFVEGITDRLLIERFLIKNSAEKFKVIEVDTIDFSSLYSMMPNLKRNNKNKLIALSNRLDVEHKNNLSNVTCIVDKDYDFFLDSIIKNQYLKYTDFTSLEMYLFNDAQIKIIYKNLLRGFPISAKKTLTELGKVLQEIFLIRLALIKNYKESEDLIITDLIKSTKINKSTGVINFDPLQHLRKILLNNKLHKDEKIYLGLIKSFRDKCSLDVRNQIRGHDFIHLFYLYINKIKNNIKLSEETLERVLFQFVDFSELHSYTLFKNLFNQYCI